jgi:hypothetical protein
LTVDLSPRDVARALAKRIDELAPYLLPGGRREGAEWRCGSVAGEPGDSLGVHLTGAKAGVWGDFATGECGDGLDLVRAVLELDMANAIRWAVRWLGLGDGDAGMSRTKSFSTSSKASSAEAPDPHRWQKPWEPARPIAGTIAEAYLRNRGLRFDDLAGDVLRFAPRRARKSPAGELEHHPALLALLRNVRTGEPCGIINIYLLPEGSDRLRDKKGKTVAGRAGGAAVMLDDFADVTLGLVVAEGVETTIALWMAELRPVWALGGAGNLKSFPVLGGIEALTIAADADEAGKNAAAEVMRRWRSAGREVLTVPPPAGDWAQPKSAGND